MRMTKRTVYARFPDKAALFRGVVQRAVDRWVVPSTICAPPRQTIWKPL